MNKREFIKRALDTSNAFISSDSEATAVNPTIWNKKLREFEEQNLVIAPQAEVFDFRNEGGDYKVTIDEAPSAAAAVDETDDISISSFSTRNVTFDPSEYGAAYQLTRKEAVRAFFNVADRMVRKLGYKLALKKDALAVSEITGNTDISSVTVNSVTDLSDLASTDGLKPDTVNRANSVIEKNYYTPTKLFISVTQKEDLLSSSNLNEAHKFGTRDAIAKGLIGELYGNEVYVSHSITTTTAGTVTYDQAILMGMSQTGEMGLGYAIKRDPIIEREYHARGRYWDIVAHEEYDFQILHPGSFCLINSYSGTA